MRAEPRQSSTNESWICLYFTSEDAVTDEEGGEAGGVAGAEDRDGGDDGSSNAGDPGTES